MILTYYLFQTHAQKHCIYISLKQITHTHKHKHKHTHTHTHTHTLNSKHQPSHTHNLYTLKFSFNHQIHFNYTITLRFVSCLQLSVAYCSQCVCSLSQLFQSSPHGNQYPNFMIHLPTYTTSDDHRHTLIIQTAVEIHYK